MTARSIYATGGDLIGPWAHNPNTDGCCVAAAKSDTDGSFSFNVSGPAGAAYAIVERDELRLIFEALQRELGKLN